MIKWVGAALAVAALGIWVWSLHTRMLAAQADALTKAEMLGEERANVAILVETAREAAADNARDRVARDAAIRDVSRLRGLRAADAVKFSATLKAESTRDPVLAACLALPLPPSLRWSGTEAR